MGPLVICRRPRPWITILPGSPQASKDGQQLMPPAPLAEHDRAAAVLIPTAAALLAAIGTVRLLLTAVAVLAALLTPSGPRLSDVREPTAL